MTTKQFIEKAIEGGYDWNVEIPPYHDQLCEIILDPKAWEAVGKVEEWHQEIGMRTHHIQKGNGWEVLLDWQYHMHAMIDALIEGKTIEEYLETI